MNPPCSERCGRVAQQRGLCTRCYRARAAAGTLPPVAGYSGPTLPDLHDLGLSYRQLDYWTRCGHITADDPSPGSGHRRTWPGEQLELAERMARLVISLPGVSLSTVAAIARQPDVDVELAPGVTVSVATRPHEEAVA